MQRKAKAEVASAPSAAQIYPKPTGRGRAPGEEYKGVAANLLCIAIGAIIILIIQSYSGTLGGKPKGWNMKNVTLRYFNLRGRSESIRLFLEDLGQPYREVRLTREEWVQIKNDTSTFAFNQLPQIEDNGLPVVQSQAIMRYIGRAYDLLGESDFDKSMADVVAGGVEDLRQKYAKLVYDPDFSQEKLEQYIATVIPLAMQQFEDLLGRLGKVYFVSSSSPIFVDYLVWDVIDVHRRMAPHALRPFPLLANWFHTMEARPRLHAYLRSERRPKWVNGNIANFDNEKTGSAVKETAEKAAKKAKSAKAAPAAKPDTAAKVEEKEKDEF